MCRILIFGGTSEGRELTEFCAENKIPSYISVTTEYGGSLLPESGFIKILTGRLDCGQMTDFIRTKNIVTVIDSTHPYAKEATENIKSACTETGAEYLRLVRKTSEISGTVFNNLDSVIEYLNKDNRRILSTLGSKELPELKRINNYNSRIHARVLPAEKIHEYCLNLGFENIISEKPPFSAERNIMHIKNTGAEILLTKESGKAGGYPEKAEAAEICGIELVTLSRPEESGYDIEEIKKIIKQYICKL